MVLELRIDSGADGGGGDLDLPELECHLEATPLNVV